MHPFASYVLRSYYQATGWNEDNLFANLTRSSNAILDFTVPRGLHLSVSKSPNELFNTSYSMTAMPSLHGSVGYIFTSCALDIKSSGNVYFKDMLERFKVYDQPRRPEGKEEEWLAGERSDIRDYLLYGRFYLPSGRLDALYSTRLTPTLQAVVAAISDPPSKASKQILRPRTNDGSNVMISLQHDVGKWATEYSWSAEDSMWGFKFIHNFGRMGVPPEPALDDNASTSTSTGTSGKRPKRVDEEDAVEGGLKGRVSAGAEFYFSAKEKSAGVSTGIRFSTLPDATPPSFLLTQTPSSSPLSLSSHSSPIQKPQPPTTITALFNPMLGHTSAAYSARVSRDLSLSSRFDFNMYSYESEWAMGAEWWVRARKPSVFNLETEDGHLETSASEESISVNPHVTPASETVVALEPVYGVVKARASTNNDVALMWEGRIRNMLVSLGVVADFSNRSKPIRAAGIELSYFSAG